MFALMCTLQMTNSVVKMILFVLNGKGCVFSPGDGAGGTGSMNFALNMMTCALNMMNCALHMMNCALNKMNCALNMMKCALNMMKCALNVMNCALNMMNCALNMMNCALEMMNCALHKMNCALEMMNCALNMMKCALNMMNCALHKMNCALNMMNVCTESLVGNANDAQSCAALVVSSEPTANGATFSSTGTACYAEFGQTSSNAAAAWQNWCEFPSMLSMLLDVVLILMLVESCSMFTSDGPGE